MLEQRSKARCFWVESIKESAPAFPALDGEVEVDVAVIGAGIAGLSTAEKLIAQGKSVAIVDALRVGPATENLKPKNFDNGRGEG